jgi:hypothetical protein
VCLPPIPSSRCRLPLLFLLFGRRRHSRLRTRGRRA